MSKPKPPSYRTTNWPDYNAALARLGSLAIWFDPETQWLAAPTGRRGRQPVFTDAAIQACLALKALFGLTTRRRLYRSSGRGAWRRSAPEESFLGTLDVAAGRCCTTLTVEDSHCESMRLDGPHEQAITRPLSRDELVQLDGVTTQARVAAHLAGQGDDLARVA